MQYLYVCVLSDTDKTKVYNPLLQQKAKTNFRTLTQRTEEGKAVYCDLSYIYVNANKFSW